MQVNVAGVAMLQGMVQCGLPQTTRIANHTTKKLADANLHSPTPPLISVNLFCTSTHGELVRSCLELAGAPLGRTQVNAGNNAKGTFYSRQPVPVQLLQVLR